MTSTAFKSVLVCAISAAALLVAGRASAQYGPFLASSDFTMYLESWDASQGQWVQMNSTQQQHFFNQARCQCNQDPNGEIRVAIQPGIGVPQKITTLLQANPAIGGQGVGRLFVGTANVDCLAFGGGTLASYCTNLLDPNNYPGTAFTMSAVALANVWTSDAIPVARLFGAYQGCGPLKSCDSTLDCATTNATVNIQFWAQTNSGGSPDFDGIISGAAVNVVGVVPVAPTVGTVEGGNEALIVNWNWPSGVNPATATTILGVQLFCQRGLDTQIFQSGAYAPAYITAASLCPAIAPPAPTNGPFSSSDPRYLCSMLIPPTATSHRITGLQNGIPYGVGIAAVDKYGNISAISDIVYGTPRAGTPPADGAVGSSDAGAEVTLTNGCSCDVRGKGNERKAAGFWGLAMVVLAARKSSFKRTANKILSAAIALLVCHACSASAKVTGGAITTGGALAEGGSAGGGLAGAGGSVTLTIPDSGALVAGDAELPTAVPTAPQYAELWYSSGDSLVYIQLNKGGGSVVRFVASPVTGLAGGQNSITMLQDGSLLGLRLVGTQSRFYWVKAPPRDGSPVTPVQLGIMPDAIMIEALYTDCSNRLFAMDTGVDVGSSTGNRLLYISGNYLAGDFTYKVVSDFSQNTADIDDLGPGIGSDGRITDNPGFAIDTGTVYRFNYETAVGVQVGKGGTWGIHALGGSLFDDGLSRLYLLSSQAELFRMDPTTFVLSPVLGKGPTVTNSAYPAHSGLAGPLTNCTSGFITVF